MALFEDALKGGNIITGLAIGVGAAVLAPVVIPLMRPVAKSVLKAGMLASDNQMRCLVQGGQGAGNGAQFDGFGARPYYERNTIVAQLPPWLRRFHLSPNRMKLASRSVI